MQARLASQQAPGICLSPPAQHWDCRHCHGTQLVRCPLGTKLACTGLSYLPTIFSLLLKESWKFVWSRGPSSHLQALQHAHLTSDCNHKCGVCPARWGRFFPPESPLFPLPEQLLLSPHSSPISLASSICNVTSFLVQLYAPWTFPCNCIYQWNHLLEDCILTRLWRPGKTCFPTAKNRTWHKANIQQSLLREHTSEALPPYLQSRLPSGHFRSLLLTLHSVRWVSIIKTTVLFFWTQLLQSWRPFHCPQHIWDRS